MITIEMNEIGLIALIVAVFFPNLVIAVGLFGGMIQDLKKQKKEKTIEKRLKTLEIIKEKKVDIFMLDASDCLQDYNEDLADEYQLTREEYNLVKRWLK